MFVNSFFPEIHTNTVERLWKSVKEHIKKHKIRSLFKLCVGRFFFSKILQEEEQLKYLIESLQNEYINYNDLEV